MLLFDFLENLAFIWPYFIFRIWPLLKLRMAKFDLFNFFGPGNPFEPCFSIDMPQNYYTPNS